MIRVLAVDDHPIITRGVRDILADTEDVKLVRCVESAAAAFEAIDADTYDVVLMDIQLPDMNGIDAVKHVHQTHPRLPVLIMTVYDEKMYAVRAIRAGASGYIVKGSAAEQLVTAIRTVSSGGKYITPSLAEKLAYAISYPTDGPLHENLSDREYQVFQLLAMGGTVTAVAEQLGLSRQTVTTYRRRILDKMGMETNTDLARYAAAEGLVSPM